MIYDTTLVITPEPTVRPPSRMANRICSSRGGTTLSKIFGVIRRFSEDIDLAVDWEMLGFVGERSPSTEMSNTKRNKLLAEMLEACRKYIATEFVKTLRQRIAEELPAYLSSHALSNVSEVVGGVRLPDDTPDPSAG